ncbi:MAG: hypothetical protein QM621_09980 [Aeromicrobium sp.]|uniref:hypothetical protein n=1 Tax=Aeromicrobium sp. TaxID=1871063 RepID=UPI0039E663A0
MTSRLVALLLSAVLALVIAPTATSAAENGPAVPDCDSLTEKNAGDVEVVKEGARITIATDEERVYPVLYPGDEDPVTVGWLTPTDGVIGIDLSIQPAGEIVVALLDAEGEVLGWGATELTEEESNAPEPKKEKVEEKGDVSPAVLAVALVFAVLIGGGALLAYRSSRSGASTDDDAQTDDGDAEDGDATDGDAEDGDR